MRDINQNPYSPDEQRVAQFFFDLGVGGGDDPIGFIIASHQVLAANLNEWKQAAGVEAGLRREFNTKFEEQFAKVQALREIIADAIEALESMDLHVNNTAL